MPGTTPMNSLTPRTLTTFRAAALASPVMIALVVAMSFFYPSTLPSLPPGFFTPVLAMEFVTSQADAQAIFAGDLELVQRTQTGHLIDMAFALAYGAFLALANLGCWYWQRRLVNLAGVLLAVLAAAADCIENLQLLRVGDVLLGQAAAPDFGLLRICVSIKFASIALSMLCLVPPLWPHGWPGKGFALVSILLVPVALTALALANRPDTHPLLEAVAILMGPGWILLLVWLIRIRKVLLPRS